MITAPGGTYATSSLTESEGSRTNRPRWLLASTKRMRLEMYDAPAVITFRDHVGGQEILESLPLTGLGHGSGRSPHPPSPPLPEERGETPTKKQVRLPLSSGRGGWGVRAPGRGYDQGRETLHRCELPTRRVGRRAPEPTGRLSPYRNRPSSLTHRVLASY